VKLKMHKALFAASAVAFAGLASAATINQGLVSGVLNTIEDQDREAYIDVDQSGTLSVGDVFIGFVRMDNFNPGGAAVNNQVYGVISNQILSVAPGDSTILNVGVTTTAGLTLQDLTGDANATGGMFAIYDSAAPYGNNLITDPPGGAVSIFDYINYIVSGGTLRLTTGIAAADDYLMVDNGPGFPIGSTNSTFPTLPTSVTVNNFTGGLSVLYNNTNFAYADGVATVDALGVLHINQVGVGNGSTRGAAGDGDEAIYGNAPGWTQCNVGGANTACGFVTDADFFVIPTAVPEPTSLALMGAALLGFVGARRVRKSMRG